MGQPIGAFYTLHFQGVDPATGDAIYEDLNGDGAITADDRTIVGSPHPDYTGGLTSTLTYKGFDLTGFLAFSQGNEVFNAMRIFSDAGGWYLDNQFTDVLRPLAAAGRPDRRAAGELRRPVGRERRSRAATSRTARTGGCRTSRSGYRLPERWAGALGFASARFYGSARNLFTITDYKGYSPDVNSNGASNNASGISDLGSCPASVWAPTSTPTRWPARTPSASRPPGSRHRRTGAFAMTIRFALAFALVVSLAGCNSMLDQDPVDQLPDADAITNARGARAALAGAYNALESMASYYGEDFVELGRPAGRQRGQHRHLAGLRRRRRQPVPRRQRDALSASGTGSTTRINRVNIILERVPAVTDLDDTEKNEILGEAHFLRALHYHNLVKLYGDVPIRAHAGQGCERGRRTSSGARWRMCTPRSWPTWARRDPDHRDRADHAGHPGRRGRADRPGCSCTGRTTPRRWRRPTW